jgi:hypothetical protein
MTKSEQIRRLAAEGLSRSDIAKRLGIRYQHVYNVLKGSAKSKVLSAAANTAQRPENMTPAVLSSVLVQKGFVELGNWELHELDGIRLSSPPPAKPGVYIFSLNGSVVYVGVSERSLKQRLYFYSKPGPRQLTSIRIKKLILEHLRKGDAISVCVAHPESMDWRGVNLPMDTALEAGLIRAYRPIWNKMGL